MFGNGANTPTKAGWNNENWLTSRFHFNFAEHRKGPSNFGVLSVMNDNFVQPARSFGAHPYQDSEIITFVVDGSLTHKDTMGTQETPKRATGVWCGQALNAGDSGAVALLFEMVADGIC